MLTKFKSHIKFVDAVNKKGVRKTTKRLKITCDCYNKKYGLNKSFTNTARGWWLICLN